MNENRIPPAERMIHALIRLLSEENFENGKIVRGRLLDYGEAAVPLLRQALVEGGPADRISEILEELRLRKLGEEFRLFAQTAEPDLEQGAWLLSRLKYGSLRRESVQAVLDRMAQCLGRRVAGSTDRLDTLERFQRYFYQEEGYHGNTQDYYDPDNSFLHRVLERKIGIPISLAAVILLVGRRLGLPFYGIGAPGHFLVQYGEGKDGILLDPFSPGAVLNREKIARSLYSGTPSIGTPPLNPVNDRAILTRMMRNLISIYRQRGEQSKVQHLISYHALIHQESSSST